MGEVKGSEMLLRRLNKIKPYLAILSLQFGFAGMYVISMVSLKHGMSHFILATYRHVVATLVVAPFAFFLERSSFFFSSVHNFSFFTQNYTSRLLNESCVLNFCYRKIRPKMTLPVFLRIIALGFLE